MIGAAERLVAEDGPAAMSLREIHVVSNQKNKSAAQYHFGSRDGLIEAAVLARMGAVNERRCELLTQIDRSIAEPGDRSTADLLRPLAEAMVRPLAGQTILTPSSHWARFILQYTSDPTISQIVRRSVEGQAYRDTHDRLTAAITHVPEVLRRRRVDHAIGMVSMSLADAEADRDSGGPLLLSPAAQVEELIDSCVGLLDAPSSAATLDALALSPDHRPTA